MSVVLPDRLTPARTVISFIAREPSGPGMDRGCPFKMSGTEPVTHQGFHSAKISWSIDINRVVLVYIGYD